MTDYENTDACRLQREARRQTEVRRWPRRGTKARERVEDRTIAKAGRLMRYEPEARRREVGQ